jgi:hypothetical protein
MLVSVAHFVEQPEGILIERLPGGIWGEVTDNLPYSWLEELKSPVRNGYLVSRSALLDGERRYLLVLNRHRGGVLPGQGEHDVVEAIPHALERIPDDQRKFTRERLQLLCHEQEAFLAVGLTKDSITIATPFDQHCFDILDVSICPGQPAAVAGG